MSIFRVLDFLYKYLHLLRSVTFVFIANTSAKHKKEPLT